MSTGPTYRSANVPEERLRSERAKPWIGVRSEGAVARVLGLGALGFALSLASPTSAQSFEEAVWTNASLALQFCLSGFAAPEDRASWFRDAGFAEQVSRSQVNSDTTHFFSAPADTVSVELYYGEMPEHCIVTSDHMGVARGSALLDALIPQILPGYLRRTVAGAGANCVTYEDPTNPIGQIVGVVARGDLGCVENGTVRFYSSYRV
ncbi:hypothetical protein [uncultured Roseobacter sp.]|uniref:hypothetical protein n=1 Tax=uncultured Roseobacter sp. TaxID=114847 RepID=UPI0026046BAD|nr:hypothetical protein [uncultured Roseobacter sp.]